MVGTDKIVVSYSTITSAIHIAAYMGAANIIVVGHDCGKLDGELNTRLSESPMGTKFYSDFVGQIETSTIQLRTRIKEVYGCNLYSLNPFVNFGIEGHKYEKMKILLFCPTWSEAGVLAIRQETLDSIDNLIRPEGAEVTVMISDNNIRARMGDRRGDHENTLHQYKLARWNTLEKGIRLFVHS